MNQALFILELVLLNESYFLVNKRINKQNE
jgi:hypothetical protein